MKKKVLMSWSGGKDSAVALDELLRDGRYEVIGLLTSVSEEYRRISHHGVREELLEKQAESIGIPLDKVYLPSDGGKACSNDVYEAIMSDVMAKHKAAGVELVAFGDLFLEDLRAYRERNLARGGMSGLFPVWKRDTSQFAREVIRRGFKSYLSCVEGKVGPGFVGRAFDEALLSDLPAGTDPCGEYGEFHSFVWDGPIFKSPVSVTVGEIVVRDGRYYADLLPADAPSSTGALAASIPPV
jgi:uncharacterized protein (TIGR00290 family)